MASTSSDSEKSTEDETAHDSRKKRYTLRQRRNHHTSRTLLDYIEKKDLCLDDADDVLELLDKHPPKKKKKKAKCGRKRKYPDEKSVREGATTRERRRMHGLTGAFEELRRVIPQGRHSSFQKMTKIATLRLAIQYIALLSRTLDNGSRTEEPWDSNGSVCSEDAWSNQDSVSGGWPESLDSSKADSEYSEQGDVSKAVFSANIVERERS